MDWNLGRRVAVGVAMVVALTGCGAHDLATGAAPASSTGATSGFDEVVAAVGRAKGGSWSTRFDVPGTSEYYCRFHPGMAGTIVVTSVR